MSFLKPKTKATATNTNNALLTSTYSPSMQQGVGAQNFLGSLLMGTGDTGAANAGWDQYKSNAGYENALRNISRGVVGGGAASGLLRSGSTANALLSKAGEYNQGMFNNYLGQLFNLTSAGQNAGQIVANAGSGQLVTKPSTAGTIASTISGIASIFSDERLKEDAVKIAELSDGLGLWSFRYLGGVKRFVGVMAHEVARFRPWALGPSIAGYRTVNMGAL